MATNWPPTPTYPPWPPVETGEVRFSDIQTGIRTFQEAGFTRENPTAQENNTYFKGIRCDESHPCQGIMLVSPSGLRYPFAYCTGATHKSALVLWIVGYDHMGQPCYDLGWGSGDLGA